MAKLQLSTRTTQQEDNATLLKFGACAKKREDP